MPQVSFARFKTWMTTSNAERAPSLPSGRWDVESIVESRGGCEELGGMQAMRKSQSPNTDGSHFASCKHSHLMKQSL